MVRYIPFAFSKKDPGSFLANYKSNINATDVTPLIGWYFESFWQGGLLKKVKDMTFWRKSSNYVIHRMEVGGRTLSKFSWVIERRSPTLTALMPKRISQ